MAIIQLEAGLFSLRLGHGAALTCHRHVIHSRAAASLSLKLPRCAVVFTQQHRFFDSLRIPVKSMISRGFPMCKAILLFFKGAFSAGESRVNKLLQRIHLSLACDGSDDGLADYAAVSVDNIGRREGVYAVGKFSGRAA